MKQRYINNTLKHLIMFIGILLFAMFLVSCKDKTPEINNTQLLTEIYSDLLVYQERLEQLTIDVEPELSTSTNQLLSIDTYEYSTYTRQQLLERYLESTNDLVDDVYLEQLLTTKDFVSQVREFIADDLDQEIGALFYPDPENLDMTYRFLLSSDGYIVIEAIYDINHTFLKIGMSDDQLEYYEIHYNYQGVFDPLDDSQLVYNYFTFVEDVEAVQVNSLGDNFSLNYTSMIDHTHIQMSKGANELGGEFEYEEGSAGYFVSMYDSESLIRTNIDIVNNQIESESYEVFTEHGLLYAYYDHPMYGDDIKLITNFIEATGWDHLIVTENNGGNPGELDGIYDANNNALYSGRLRFNYHPNYAYAAIDQYIQRGTLTDSDLNLSNYGINLNHSKATTAYLNSIKVTDFNNFKQSLIFDNLNFFAPDLETELYDYLDIDIRASIEGTNDPVEIDGPTGDGVEDFEAFMTSFYDAYDNNPELIQTETGTFSILDSRTDLIETKASSLSLSINQSAMYFNISEFTGDYGSYTIMMFGDRFFEFNKVAGRVDYRSFSDDTSPAFFTNLLSQNTSVENPMKGIISVNKAGVNTYQVVMTKSALGLLGDYLLDDYSFYGFADAEYIATYTFDSDQTHFTYEIEITGLMDYSYYFNPKPTTYHGQGEVKLDTVEIVEPIRPNDTLYFPSDKADILYATPFNFTTRYLLHEGNNYGFIQLEAGNYRVQGIVGYDVDIRIEDENGNIISDGNGLFTVNDFGNYYIVIHSSVKQSVDLMVFSYTPPNLNEGVFPSTSGTYSQTYVEGEVYYINIPATDQNRLLYISLDKVASILTEEDMFSIQADPYEVNSDHMCVIDYMMGNSGCYFNIQNNTEVTLQIDTPMTGVVAFDYEFLAINPVEMSEIDVLDLNDIPPVILVDILNQVQLNFTITEERQYMIEFDFMRFGDPLIHIGLYDEFGVLIEDDMYYFNGTLEAGNYYILFDIFETTEETVIINTMIN